MVYNSITIIYDINSNINKCINQFCKIYVPGISITFEDKSSPVIPRTPRQLVPRCSGVLTTIVLVPYLRSVLTNKQSIFYHIIDHILRSHRMITRPTNRSQIINFMCATIFFA